MSNINKNKKVAILMATYNGERYLKRQLDSLFAQTYSAWTLYVHDDGSTDNTCEVLSSNISIHPNMVILDLPKHLGACDGFLSMMSKIDADYYFFCDQDDVWVPTKVEKELEAMARLELQHPTKPIVVYSDLRVVGPDLSLLHDSYWKMAGIYPDFFTCFSRFAASSVTTGCTMCFNHEAKKDVVYPAKSIAMHDAWVTLCCMKHGGIVSPIKEKLVLYCQHGNNTLGAHSAENINLGYRISHARQMFLQNKKHFAMLRALGYSSIFKYIQNKINYRRFISQCLKTE